MWLSIGLQPAGHHDQVDALYAQSDPLPADAIGPKMAWLRREHHRLLGNGHSTRPTELDCAFEPSVKTCSFFQTTVEFRRTLQAQLHDAADKGQAHRADLLNQLLTNATEGEASCTATGPILCTMLRWVRCRCACAVTTGSAGRRSSRAARRPAVSD